MDGAHRGRSTSKARRPPTTATTTRQSRHEQNPDKAKLTTTPSASLNAKVIIFALYESRVYVPIPETFDEAIDLAYETFPSHLAHVFRNRIGFSVKRLVDNRYSQVAISSKAWRAVAAGMTQYEVIYVDVSHRRPPRPSPSLEQQQADLTSSSGRSSHPPHSRSQSPGPYNSGSSRSSSVSSSSSSRYDVRSTHERSVDGPVGGGEGDHGQLTLDEITYNDPELTEFIDDMPTIRPRENSVPVHRASGRNVKDPNAPKKPLSAYFKFLEHIRRDQSLVDEVFGDETEPSKQSVLAAVKWRSMTDEERKPFIAQAELDKLEYEAARKIYEGSLSRQL